MAKAPSHLQAIVISIAVSLFLGYATYTCLETYTNFEMETTRLTIARDQIRQAKAQRKRVDQYNKTMASMAIFTSQVHHFGLTPEQWQSYDVSVNKSLTFADTGNILDQLSHNKTYYFIPTRLFIGTGNYKTDRTITSDTEDDNAPAPPAPTSTADNETESGDVSFSVQGRFMVRDSL